MGDGDRIAAFLERYADRLEAWIESLSTVASKDADALAAPLARVLQDLIEDLQGLAENAPPSLERFRAAVDSGALTPHQLAEAALAADTDLVERLADRTGLPPAACRAVGNLLARPLLRAGLGSPPTPGGASELECPVCGRFASMGFLLPEGGKRTLWCGACASTWSAARMACPACGNSDQHTLGYLKIDGDDARRIDTCRACGCYLKTVDLRVRGVSWTPARADLELWRSADLDRLAAREGFDPPRRAPLPTT
jgi:hypothetical protein